MCTALRAVSPPCVLATTPTWLVSLNDVWPGCQGKGEELGCTGLFVAQLCSGPHWGCLAGLNSGVYIFLENRCSGQLGAWQARLWVPGYFPFLNICLPLTRLM